MLSSRHKDTLTLGLSSFESRILRRVFTSIIQNYKIKPGQLDPKVAAVWYSTRGCETAKMSADETRDWLETLHGYKSANLELLEQWNKQLAQGKAAGALALGVPSRVIGKMAEERPHFIASISDMGEGGMVPAGGGVIIADNEGTILGAMGVTGDTSENDEACAFAAIESQGLTALN